MRTKTLNLTLHKKWYDMILLGKKKEEYREITSYWIKRLANKEYNIVIFNNGYHKNRRRMMAHIRCIFIGNGNPEWGAERDRKYFVISFCDIKELI